MSDPTFWVAISFFGFIGLLVYLKVPGMVAKALDDRADAIRKELDEARKLREEARALLAEYQRKQKEAEQSADEIVTQARKEAESLAAETRQALQDSLEKRGKLAEEKIALAELQAIGEVRAAAVDIAIAAAEKLIEDKLSVHDAERLIDQSIQDVKTKLN